MFDPGYLSVLEGEGGCQSTSIIGDDEVRYMTSFVVIDGCIDIWCAIEIGGTAGGFSYTSY